MLSPSTHDAHRQARRIRHRHEDTRSSRIASHGAFVHARDWPTYGALSISADGEEISEIFGSATRVFLTQR